MLPQAQRPAAAVGSSSSSSSAAAAWLSRARRAAAATAASCLLLLPPGGGALAAASAPLPPYLPAAPPLTQDERRAIDLFENSRASVVNVTNLAARRDLYTTQVLEVPQGAGSGVVWPAPKQTTPPPAATTTALAAGPAAAAAAGSLRAPPTAPPTGVDSDDPGVGAVVVTNFHVVADSSEVRVSLYGGAEYAAAVVGTDPDRDIAVLRLVRRADLLPPGAALPGAGGGGGAGAGGGRCEAAAGIPCAGGGGGGGGSGGGSSEAATRSGGAAAPSAPAAAASAQQQQQQPQQPNTSGNTATNGSFAAPLAQPPRLPARQPPPPVQPPRPLKPIKICAPRPGGLQVGQRVYAIGAPYNLNFSFTSGIVGGVGRQIQSASGRPILGAVQHDAPINPGSSGGPLLDTGGCFVGTNTAILSPSGASAGVGFAIPADLVASSVRQILETGRVVRPVLGLSFAPDSSAEQLGVRGILVLSAREGGPAWRAGVRGTERDGYGRLVLGDIVVAVDGAPVRSSSDLYAALDRSSVGSELELTLLRGSETVAVSATLDPSS